MVDGARQCEEVDEVEEWFDAVVDVTYWANTQNEQPRPTAPYCSNSGRTVYLLDWRAKAVRALGEEFRTR
ncbi:hypothetical protein E2562_014776 [Oryza meyeriana var. granulata]|uniref:Uncharacterized protein n=1 Tax=Oryza meyeriana var. granulata TaxID=110450 RepID=A0A6G1BKT4_9ORYZ|nr:hypothetical protein E2562_014776 [Oryza meyeriana var. granulata]